MKINDVNLGGGLFRLDVEPTCWGEDVNNVPTRVMDNIMRDVASKKRNGVGGCTCGHHHEQPRHTCGCGATFTHTIATNGRACVAPNREPDGLDAHIDRPKRENYGGWDAQWGYENDLRKYRKAEEAIKACNWPCREPMKGAPNYINHNAPKPCTCVKPRVAPTRKPNTARIEAAVNALIDAITDGAW